MKAKLSFLSLGLLLGLGLNSCSSAEDVFTPEEEQQFEIKLTSAIKSLKTRGLDLDEQTTAIVAGGKVGITVKGAQTSHNNKIWTADGNNQLTQPDPIYFSGSNPVTISAYYPYNEEWREVADGATYSFVVESDQHSYGSKKSDLLYASATSDSSNPIVNLEFSHLLSKIIIKVSSTENADLSNAWLYVTNTSKEASFTAGSVECTGNSVYPILAGIANQAAAIIVPQQVKAGTKFITIELGDHTFYYTLPEDKTFKPGYVYTYDLSINDTPDLSLKNMSLCAWINDSSGDMDGDMLKEEEDDAWVWLTTPDFDRTMPIKKIILSNKDNHNPKNRANFYSDAAWSDAGCGQFCVQPGINTDNQDDPTNYFYHEDGSGLYLAFNKALNEFYYENKKYNFCDFSNCIKNIDLVYQPYTYEMWKKGQGNNHGIWEIDVPKLMAELGTDYEVLYWSGARYHLNGWTAMYWGNQVRVHP